MRAFNRRATCMSRGSTVIIVTGYWQNVQGLIIQFQPE